MTTEEKAETEPDTGPDQEEKAGFGWKQIIAGILTLAVLVLVFVGIFPQFANYKDAWTSIQNMAAGSLVLLVVATIFNVLVYVWPYQAALPGLKYWPGFVVRQTSFLISNTIPAGGAIGLGVQYGMLGDYGYGAATATTAIGITSVWNTFVTLSLPVLAAFGLVFTGDATAEMFLVALLGLVIVGGAILLFALILRSEDLAHRIGNWVDRQIARLFGLFKKDYEPAAEDGIVDFRDSTVHVVSDRWLRITATSVLQQLSQFAILFIALRAIQSGSGQGEVVTLFEAFAAFSFARLGTFIPITPGGLGTVDGLLTAFLTTAGASNADALAAVLVWRALTYFPQVFIGIGTFLYWRIRLRGRTPKPSTSTASGA